MLTAHLTASTFFGGPERQMLGLARTMSPEFRSVFLSFAEGGRSRAFLDAAVREGFTGLSLRHDTPWFRSAIRELTEMLADLGVDVLCCHGYKADLLGRIAARRCGIPVVAVSRGWTGENFKVRLYERLDRLNLRWMDRVVCVSRSQADKVRAAGVDPARVLVVHNAVDSTRFDDLDLRFLSRLHEQFARPVRCIVASVGRLSPEKGFDVLVRAAAEAMKRDPSLGFLHFGDGPGRDDMRKAIAEAGLGESFRLLGLKDDIDRYYPFFDVLVLPSFTEGLPNVVLEAFASRVPVVATAVGGTPEVVEDGVNGRLVAPGDPHALSDALLDVLSDDDRRLTMGRLGHERVCDSFTFAAQARAYERLFESLCRPVVRRGSPRGAEQEVPTG